MKALILAGGLGTRLRPLVADRPKAMAEAAGRPFLEYLVAQLRDEGFEDIVLCVGHLAGQIEDYFGDGQRWGVRVSYSTVKGREATKSGGIPRRALVPPCPIIRATYLKGRSAPYYDRQDCL